MIILRLLVTSKLAQLHQIKFYQSKIMFYTLIKKGVVVLFDLDSNKMYNLEGSSFSISITRHILIERDFFIKHICFSSKKNIVSRLRDLTYVTNGLSAESYFFFFNTLNLLDFFFNSLLFFFKVKKAFYYRFFIFWSQLSHMTKKLKKVRFKKKKSSLLFFWKKKKFFFIKFRYRIILWRRKKWRARKYNRIHTCFLKRCYQNIRVNAKNHVFQGLVNKKFFLLNNILTNKSYYNLNLIPFTELSSFKQRFVLKNLNLLKNKYFPKLFTSFSSSFLEKLTKQKVFIKLVTNIKPDKFEIFWIKYFFRKYFFFQKQFRGVLHLNELVYLIFLTFKNKDLFFLKNWLVNFLEKIGLKKHKAFLRGFKRLIITILTTSHKYLKVRGFFFDIRGKVGVAGNAKKRHTAIKFQRYGFTSIKLKADQIKFIIRTNTGVLGVTSVLTY